MSDLQTELFVHRGGRIETIYTERLQLDSLGCLSIRRGSQVEPCCRSLWRADLSPVGGPRLGPFATRSQAIAAEVAWLNQNWLPRNVSRVSLPTTNPFDPQEQM